MIANRRRNHTCGGVWKELAPFGWGNSIRPSYRGTSATPYPSLKIPHIDTSSIDLWSPRKVIPLRTFPRVLPSSFPTQIDVHWNTPMRHGSIDIPLTSSSSFQSNSWPFVNHRYQWFDTTNVYRMSLSAHPHTLTNTLFHLERIPPNFFIDCMNLLSRGLQTLFLKRHTCSPFLPSSSHPPLFLTLPSRKFKARILCSI